jgi:hypothetical protein
VAPDRPPRLAAAQAAAERERHRDPDDEQERGEHDVGERHRVGLARRVLQEARDPFDARRLVDEEHQQDVGAAEQVDRADAQGWPPGVAQG